MEAPNPEEHPVMSQTLSLVSTVILYTTRNCSVVDAAKKLESEDNAEVLLGTRMVGKALAGVISWQPDKIAGAFSACITVFSQLHQHSGDPR